MRNQDARDFGRLAVGLVIALVGAGAFAQGSPLEGASGAVVEGRPEASGWRVPDAWPSAVVPKDTPGLRYVTFSGSRFQPTGSELTYSPLGGAVYATAIPAAGLSFSLDFDLPTGAIIREVLFYLIDNDAGTEMQLSLRTYDPATGAFTVLASGSSSGAGTGLQTIVVPVSPGVEFSDANAAFRLRVQPGVGTSAHLLRGARIGYLPPVVFASGFETIGMPMAVGGKTANGGSAAGPGPFGRS
jgi:hypothetical protein